MFDFLVNVQENDQHLKAVNDALKELRNLEVLVGIPEENTSRQAGEKINNAELLYIHTNGSIKRNIPARAVIEPAIKDDQEVIGNLLKQAAQKALDGDKAGMRQGLKKAGMRGEEVSKGWFINPKNGWDSLKQSAERNRERKMTKKQVKDAKNQDGGIVHKPLIDTGDLRKAITYVIREK